MNINVEDGSEFAVCPPSLEEENDGRQVSSDKWVTTLEEAARDDIQDKDQRPDSQPAKGSWIRRKWKRVLEYSILSVIILLTWFLLAVPTIVFALPTRTRMPTTTLSESVESNSMCDQSIAYKGQVCFSELQSWQECFSVNSQQSILQISPNINQQEDEETAVKLLNGLPLLSPSLDCEAAIKPFICLYLFGSCDTNNQYHQATEAACLRLRDKVCIQEWTLAERFLGQGVLPDCSALPSQEDKCINSSMLSVQASLDSNTSVDIVCTEGYYLSGNDSLCRPLCTLWTDPPGVVLDSDNIATLVGIIITILSSIILFTVVLTLQRSTMLTFPTLYLIYCCVTATVIALLFLFEFVIQDKGKLFCSSDDLFASFENETPYCTIVGVVFTYGLSQISYWTTFHAIGICWGIVFPFHFRRIKMEGKLKYIHLTTIFLGLFLPTLPALLHLKDGYTITDSPTTLCTGRNKDITFFALVFPSSVLIAISTAACVIIFWNVLKEFLLKKLQNKPRVGIIGKVQAKILTIVCYYIMLGTVVLTTFTYFEIASDADLKAVKEHFICKSTGLQPDKDCGTTPDVHLEVFNSLSVVAIVLVGLLPAVILAFTVKWDYHKRWCKKGL